VPGGGVALIRALSALDSPRASEDRDEPYTDKEGNRQERTQTGARRCSCSFANRSIR
jgi:hypothetical protein